MPEGEQRVTTTEIHARLDEAAKLRDAGSPRARDVMQEAIDLSAKARRQADAQMAADLKTTAGHPSHETVVDAAVRKQGLLDKLLNRRPG